MRKKYLVTVLVAFMLFVVATETATALPSDFEDTLVAELSAPMDIAWTPDGHILVPDKGGRLWILENETVLPTPAIDLSAVMCTNGERALGGVAVHPDFEANHYIYLYYTFNKNGTCNESEIDGPVNRLSRFELPHSNVIDPATEVVLFDTPPLYRDHHNGGDITFGPDGLMYVTVGDGGSRSLDFPQDPGQLLGKIVRLTDTGGIPAGNPFTGPDSARCNVDGVPPAGSPPETKCQEVFSLGLRNPFRFAFDPNSPTTRYFIQDVGQHSWEEISEGPVAGADYGWPDREGPCILDSTTDCSPDPSFTDPVHWYAHGPDGGAATGGAFVPDGVWPAAYNSSYLYADYVFGMIYQLTPGGSGCRTCDPPTSDFIQSEFTTAESVVAMEFGPYNGTQALYYVTRGYGPTSIDGVRRIAFTGTGNRAPVALATASPLAGQPPLAVQFDGTTSSDPDGDLLTYAWDFEGDGTIDSTDPSPLHTYTLEGTFFAELTVDDGQGAQDTTSIRVDVGNDLPIPVIGSPTDGATFAVGEVFTLTGSAFDPDDGPLADTSLTWEVRQHHAEHYHPFLDPTAGNNIVLQPAPEPEDFPGAMNSYLEIRLTATDSSGLSATVSRNVLPRTVDLTFDSVPSGLNLLLDGFGITTPATVVSWEAHGLQVEAPDQTDGSSTSYAWLSWSDGGAQSHTINVPATTATFSASFEEVATQPQSFTPADDTSVNESIPDKNYGSRSSIKADGSPVRNIYLKFDVQGVGVAPSAALRFYALSSNSLGLNIHAVSDTSWDEDTMLWTNAPQIGQLVATTGPLQGGNWYLVDVSAAVSGDGLVALAITNLNSTSTSIESKEGANAPELHIPAVFPGSPTPFVVRRDVDTYHAESQSTSSSYSGSLKSVVESAASELNSFGGGVITFQAGDFDLGGDWFEFFDLTGVTFEGQGIDVTILRNESSAATDTEPFDFTHGNGITIRDMTVSAGGPFRSTSDALDFDAGNDNVVERVKVTGSRGKGIIFDGKDISSGQPQTADRNVVRDCVVTGVPSDGIELLASGSNRIENCHIFDVGGHGIQINRSSSSAAQPNKKSNDNTISSNLIENAGGDGINLISGDRNVLTGNTIVNSSDDLSNQDGIQITSGNSIPCDDNIVEFNTASDNQAVKTQRYGLSISSSNCNRTVVGDNNFSGNRLGDIQDNGTDTFYSSADNEAPTLPTGLATTLVAHNQVDLVWNASTDNVGVVSYTVYRDGVPVTAVDGTTTTYQDVTVVPEATYDYTVEAFDAAGNSSGQSAPLQVTTPVVPPDDQAPSIPTNLRTTNVTYAAADLAWDPSTDNVGVSSYTIYRDGTPIGSVDGSTTVYQDGTVDPGMSYVYNVEAFDAAGNFSGQSDPLPVTTPSAPSVFSFVPVADSYVDENRSTRNFGRSKQLRIDGSPERNAYLRFEVQGLVGTVTQATLRVYANSSSSVGYDIHSVSNNSWDEATMNYTNAPAFGPVEVSSGPFSRQLWTEVDVTLLINGDGTYSLAITTPHTTAISFGSRESANPPELIINVGP